MAREDEDVRVRRAAVAKLMDPVGARVRLPSTDRDEAVRGQAAAMLRDIALEAFEGVTEADSLERGRRADGQPRAGADCEDRRRAKSWRSVPCRASPIPGCSDPSPVTRSPKPTRRGAFERLGGDAAEILAVAMNSEHKDTAVAAVDLISDRSELDQVVSRAKSKSAREARARHYSRGRGARWRAKPPWRPPSGLRQRRRR